jgi:hypothetical protein
MATDPRRNRTLRLPMGRVGTGMAQYDLVAQDEQLDVLERR